MAKMDITEALSIVLDLASQNVIDDPEFKAELRKQNKAIKLVTRLKDSPLLDFFQE